jgi:hypothetical protein
MHTLHTHTQQEPCQRPDAALPRATAPALLTPSGLLLLDPALDPAQHARVVAWAKSVLRK